MENMEAKARPTLSKIFRNSANDLSSFDIPNRETAPLPRPRSFHLDSVHSHCPLGTSRNMASISRQVADSGSPNDDDHIEIFGYRSVFKESTQDISAPVKNISSSEETKDGDEPQRGEFGIVVDKSVYDVFNRANARELIDGAKIYEPPTLNALTDFFVKICVDSQMEYECSIIAFIYIIRMLKLSRGFCFLTEETFKGVVLSAMVLANKVWDDFAMKNSEYCAIFYGLTLQRVNELELAMFLVLRNHLWVSRSEYASAHFSVQELLTKEEIERVRNLPSNQRVPVLAPKTILSREKSRSVLSEASSMISSRSVRSINSADIVYFDVDNLEGPGVFISEDGSSRENSLSGDLRSRQPTPRIPSNRRVNASVKGASQIIHYLDHSPHSTPPPCRAPTSLTIQALGEFESAFVPKSRSPSSASISGSISIATSTHTAPGVIRALSSVSTAVEDGSQGEASDECERRRPWSPWCCIVWPFRLWRGFPQRDGSSENNYSYTATTQSKSQAERDDEDIPPDILKSKSFSDVGVI